LRNQRARAYLERLKQPGNEEKLAAFKERKREHSRRYREKQLLNNPEEYKRKRSESTKKCRAKKAGKVIEKPKISFKEHVNHVMSKLPNKFRPMKDIIRKVHGI